MGFMNRFKVKDGAPEGSTFSETFLANTDLIPLEPERRTWKARHYVSFWVSDGVNLSTAVIVASSVKDGLAWWQVWLAVWGSYFLIACAMVMSARIGAVYHIGFPVIARASFGLWGSLYLVINRAAVSCLWFAFQSWLGGGCITLLLRALWPQYANLPNHLPDSSGVTSQGLLSFFLFWLCCLPAVLTRPEKIHLLFTIKSIIVPIAFIGMFGWSVHDAGGLGPIIKQKARLQGSDRSWAICAVFIGSMGNFAGLTLNASDFSRLARRPKDTIMSQAITIPAVFIVTSFIGLIIASSSTVIFPGSEAVFNPLDLLSMRLDATPEASGLRAATAFIAAAFALGQIGTNVAANSLSAGSDLTALLPKWIDIRRGGLVCALIAFALNPWRLASSTSNFATYLAAYSVLLSPFFGTIMADYIIVRRGHYDIASLFSASKTADYRYTKGVNPRGFAAYVVGISINLPGFAAACGAKGIPIGAKRVYNLAPFTGFLLSAMAYVALQHFFPSPGAVPLSSRVWLEPKSQLGYEADDWTKPMEGGNDILGSRNDNGRSSTPSIDEEKSFGETEKPQISTYQL